MGQRRVDVRGFEPVERGLAGKTVIGIRVRLFPLKSIAWRTFDNSVLNAAIGSSLLLPLAPDGDWKKLRAIWTYCALSTVLARRRLVDDILVWPARAAQLKGWVEDAFARRIHQLVTFIRYIYR